MNDELITTANTARRIAIILSSDILCNYQERRYSQFEADDNTCLLNDQPTPLPFGQGKPKTKYSQPIVNPYILMIAHHAIF